MTSPPLDSTHGRTTSGVACHHSIWIAHTVERRQAWHAIIALGRQTRSNDVRRGMPSSPLGSTHGQMTLGGAGHHRLWAALTVERCRAWHAIIAFGLDDTVRRRRAWHAIIALGRQTRSNDVRRGMQTSPLGSTDGRTASGVACHHRLWEAHTVERCRVWHAIIAFGKHTRSNNVGRNWHAIIAFGLAYTVR